MTERVGLTLKRRKETAPLPFGTTGILPFVG